MRYSRGNRGGPGRQWGERKYDAPRPAKKRWPLKSSGTTTIAMELVWRVVQGEEKLCYLARCQNCGVLGSTGPFIDHRTHQPKPSGEHVCCVCGLIVDNPHNPS